MKSCVIFVLVVIGATSALHYTCDVDGSRYPNVFNCSAYMQCNYGLDKDHNVIHEFIERPCAAGTEFNAKTGVRIFKSF